MSKGRVRKSQLKLNQRAVQMVAEFGSAFKCDGAIVTLYAAGHPVGAGWYGLTDTLNAVYREMAEAQTPKSDPQTGGEI